MATALAALLGGAVNAAADVRPADTSVPSAPPTGLATGAIGQTSIAVRWTAPNTAGVIAYRLFRSGTQVAASTATSYTFVGLSCGSTYTLSVAALSSGGHQSAPASITANSKACTTSSGGGGDTPSGGSGTTASGHGGTTSSLDTTAPSTPTRPSAAATGQSTITLSWTASTDNVGVTGYRLSRAGSQVATSPTTSYTFTGLTCATSYTLGVSAFDAAGNASSQATISATTSACAPTVPAGPGTASLWVAPSGSVACRRAASPVGYAAAVLAGNVCDSGPTAYAKANLGDTVLIAGGTYTSSWNFAPSLSKTGSAGTCNYNYGGTASLSGCVSFAPAPGQSVVFQVAGQNTSAIRICADFVSIQGVTIAQTTYTDQFGDPVSNGSVTVGAGDNSCMPGGASPHDIYLANISYGGQASATGGASNVWFVGGTATGTSNFPWQMGGQGGNGATGYANHNGIVGITFQGASFISSDPVHHHMECVHDTPVSDHIVVASSRFISCPVESFFAQGTSQTNILVENNYFIGGGPLKFDCTTNPGCVNSGITVRYNSFAGTFLNLQNACNANGTCTGATIDHNAVYANIGDGCPSVGFGLKGAAGSGWKSAHNVEAVAARGICVGDSSSRFAVPAAYVSPGAPAYDLRLRPGAAALHAGDPASHPALDIQGLLRPLRVAPAAGAAQNETAELDVGRSVGAVALGMSAAGVATAYGLKSIAVTTDKPRVVHYRIDGRDVWLRYVRGAVAGIETTSPYYTTRARLGVASTAAAAVAAGFKWNVECRKAYRRLQAGVATYLVPRGGIEGNAIAVVRMVRVAQDECPRRRP